MRRYIVDTTAMVIFSTILGAFVEIIIAGLSIQQSARVRLAAVPIILLAGRPYGIYRDWLFKCMSGERAGLFKSAAIDTFANVSFQLPLYIALLAFNGAAFRQIIVSVSSIALIVMVSGRPYGIFLSLCRRIGGVPVLAGHGVH